MLNVLQWTVRTVRTFFDARNFARSGARDGIFKLLRSTEIDAASLCSLAGRYSKPIPTHFLVTIRSSKIQHCINYVVQYLLSLSIQILRRDLLSMAGYYKPVFIHPPPPILSAKC